jgi:hypothetical protein
MRLFVRHTKDGEIVSVAKANVLPEGLEHPYVDVGEEEAVLEIEPPPELEPLDAHEIAERYTVNVQEKALRPRNGAGGGLRQAGRSRRSRKDT